MWSSIQKKEISKSLKDKLKLAIGIVKGMIYLHSFKIPVIHRDLKSLNILLDKHNNPKIADFGVTRLLSKKTNDKVGTIQWMAPETISSQLYNEKTDVYSFGIILWEIFFEEAPYKSKII